MVEKEENLFDKEVQATESVETEDLSVKAPESASSKPTVGDFDDSAPIEYTHTTIQIEDEMPKPQIFTIESIETSSIKPGEEPNENDFGKSYKKKLIVNFVEKLNDKAELKLRSIMPSIYLNERDGKYIPNIPKPCLEEDLDDSFTSEVAKFRFIFCRDFPEFALVKDAGTGKERLQTPKEFVTSLIGKKIEMKKVIKKYKDQDSGASMPMAKLFPIKFVK